MVMMTNLDVTLAVYLGHYRSMQDKQTNITVHFIIQLQTLNKLRPISVNFSSPEQKAM